MRELISFCFKGGEKQFIPATKFSRTWSDDKNKFKKTFDNISLELAINFLLDNCIFNFGNFSTNQQTNPIGSSPAPFKVNLYL